MKTEAPLCEMQSGASYCVELRCRDLAAELGDVLGGRALRALDDVELDALAFGKRAEARTLDRRVVDEAILLSTLRRDEAKALRGVEPLHGAGRASHTKYS